MWVTAMLLEVGQAQLLRRQIGKELRYSAQVILLSVYFYIEVPSCSRGATSWVLHLRRLTNRSWSIFELIIKTKPNHILRLTTLSSQNLHRWVAPPCLSGPCFLWLLATQLLEATGVSEPLTKIYMTCEPMEQLPLVLFLAILQQMSLVQYNSNFATLVRLKSKVWNLHKLFWNEGFTFVP
jgi:hypothetical protein